MMEDIHTRWCNHTLLMIHTYLDTKAAEGGLGWGKNYKGSGGRESLSGVQGRSPGRGPGDEVPPEAEEFLK